MPTINRGSHVIDYQVEGPKDAPAVLLIMGLGMPARAWGTLPALLANRYRVIVLDNRGTGGSSLPKGTFRISDMADDAVAVLDAAGVAEAAVIGVSMGGMITIELALHHPKRVRALVLGCTHGGYRTSKKPSLKTTWSLLRGTTGGTVDLARMASFLVSNEYFAQHPDEFHAWLRSGGRPNPKTIAKQMLAIARYEATSRLARISVPTLVITGDADDLVPSANSRRLADRIPRAKLILLPGKGHAFRLEAEEESGAAIDGFLDEVLLGKGPHPSDGAANDHSKGVNGAGAPNGARARSASTRS